MAVVRLAGDAKRVSIALQPDCTASSVLHCRREWPRRPVRDQQVGPPSGSRDGI